MKTVYEITINQEVTAPITATRVITAAGANFWKAFAGGHRSSANPSIRKAVFALGLAMENEGYQVTIVDTTTGEELLEPAF